MLRKKLFSSLLTGILLSFSVGCGNQNTTFIPDPSLSGIQANNINTFARRNNSGSQLTFATYNVRNLFDGIQNPGKEPETAKPEKELEYLGASIDALNADVIALQEVESKSTVDNFVKKYVKDKSYKTVLIEAYDARGIDVAILTRLPVKRVKSHKDVKFDVPGQGKEGFSRDLLQVDLQAGSYNFTAFVTHLKSKHGGDESTVKRHAEALKISEIIGNFHSQNPNANFVLAGDFNDTPDSKALTPLLKGAPLSDLIMEDLGNADYVYTYHPQKYRSRIDYILVSPGMKNEYIKKSVEIHKVLPGGEDVKWSFFRASDHLPVTAKFDISQDR